MAKPAPLPDAPAEEAPISPLAERTLRFVRRHRAYNSGDVAGFGREHANKLIQAGIAVDASVAPAPMVRK